MRELARRLAKETSLPQAVVLQIVGAVVNHLAKASPNPVSILLQLWWGAYFIFRSGVGPVRTLVVECWATSI